MLESKSPTIGAFVCSVLLPVLCSEKRLESILILCIKCWFCDSGMKSTPIFKLVVSIIGILSLEIEEVVLVDWKHEYSYFSCWFVLEISELEIVTLVLFECDFDSVDFNSVALLDLTTVTILNSGSSLFVVFGSLCCLVFSWCEFRETGGTLKCFENFTEEHRLLFAGWFLLWFFLVIPRVVPRTDTIFRVHGRCSRRIFDAVRRRRNRRKIVAVAERSGGDGTR